MGFDGEHLWVGMLGRAAIITAFVSALLAMICYGLSTSANPLNDKQKEWKRIGQGAFIIHGFSVFMTIGLIFFLMLQRYYEYEYAWGHVSDDLPFRYIFSAFWEGQEGSFLLWAFWHVILGFVLMRKAGEWEPPVMAVMAAVELGLMSMLLGYYVGETDMRIGSSPFALMRDVHWAPLFNNPDYVQELYRRGGTGLNPLLQNYWMTIHPPTLFLGFASTLVPCAYAIAGLWRKKYTEWIKPVLPWALFSGAILGTGILMGGAWAYEALSFGGYWAWDPVENASLVPWITLVAGIHMALVAKNTGRGIGSAYWFFVATFILIIYSTFLTRSGILNETSVHAFTEMGLMWQLVLFIFLITLYPTILYFRKRKGIPKIIKEESAYSKEFWLFVGSLILLFSAGLITYTTSIPVFNAIADGFAWLFGAEGDNPVGDIAPPEDVVAHHNKFQIWIGILVAILSGAAQFLRYKVVNTGTKYGSFVLRHLLSAVVIAIVLLIPIILLSDVSFVTHYLLIFAGLFSVVANLDYVLTVLKGKISISGSAVGHIGFGIMMIGIVFSGALKSPISEAFGSDELDGILGGLNQQTNKSVLVPRGENVEIKDGYFVKYDSTREEGNMQIYDLIFTRKDEHGNIVEEFTTTPNVLYEDVGNGNKRMQASNPDTKHYLSRDVFTLAVPQWAFDDPEEIGSQTKDKWVKHSISIGDTIYSSKHYIIFEGLEDSILVSNYTPQVGDVPVTARLTIRELKSNNYWVAQPFYYIRNKREFSIEDRIDDLALQIKLTHIDPRQGKFDIEILDENKGEYVVVQALIFPGIQLVWLGGILMFVGMFMAMFQRMKKPKFPDREKTVEII